MSKILFFILLLQSPFLFSQEKRLNTFFEKSDTLNKKRLIVVCTGQGILWAGSMIALNKTWYSNYPRSSFHLFNDIEEWQQVDKVGHAWSAYWGAQFSTSLFKWSGLSHKQSVIYGAAMGIAYESVIEILDGFSKKWGFSLGDMAANTGGSLLFATQEYIWSEQRISIKFSTHPYHYSEQQLKERAHNLYGSSPFEIILKDYNAQTYWLSAGIKPFIKNSKFPAWLNIAVGYGADGLYGGFDNIERDDNNQIVMNANGMAAFDRRDISRRRQFYLAPDIDLSKIKNHGKCPKILKLLNGLRIKFPMPTLEYKTGSGFKFHALYF